MNAACQTSERRVLYRFEEIDVTLGIEAVEILTTDRDGEAPKACQAPELFAMEEGFWRRQFGTTVTAKQRGFDWIMGVFLPIVCFFLDPIVFRTNDSLFGKFRIFAYSLAIISILAMAAWQLFGDKLEWLSGLFAGLFFAGSMVSFGLGIVLLPYSVLGMIMLIGFLGFTPLFSAMVYSRNAVRAMRSAEPFFEIQTLKYVAMLAGLLTIVLPWVANQAGK